jgi:FMN phosphatase YigB (HAD superfamily)
MNLLEDRGAALADHAVIFDIGNVLSFPCAESAAGHWIEEHVDRTPEQWDAIEVNIEVLKHESSLGIVSENELGRRIRTILDLDDAGIEDYMCAVWADCVGVPNVELIEYFRSLRRRCKTGILSNSYVGSSSRQDRAHGFSALTDQLVFSNEIGFLKPDRQAYEVILHRLGVEACMTLFVDDNTANIDAARELGMRGVLYSSNELTIAQVEEWLRERQR